MQEHILIQDFTEKAYLDYAMYVILDRALPHVGDGFKPVQRRLIYTMAQLGLTPQHPYKKSVRTVGEVLGKYHPHGEAACYEAMVLLAQEFSCRYPLIDGQGNWGSIDNPKSFAAMRYTESRLTPYARLLLLDLSADTVDWQANFDGSLQEPKLLPARLPNIVLNGSSGIAVGMATDIPPHQLGEVVDACVALLKDPDLSDEALLDFIPAPDYPSGGEMITPLAEVRNIYLMGQGSLKLRAHYQREGQEIIIDELPYQVSCSKIQEQIAAQMQQKKLPWLEDVRDDSDHRNPVRLVLVLQKNCDDPQAVIDHLFASTDLEKSYRIQFNMIGLDGKPQNKSLPAVLREWLQFRLQTLRARLQARAQRVEERRHILAGLLIVFINLDEVIRIIREEDKPKVELMRRFALSDAQAEAILETKLRHLAKLEELQLRGEEDKLAKEAAAIQAVLNNPSQLRKRLRQELLDDKKIYNDTRRTRLIERRAAVALDERLLLPVEPISVVLSRQGWIRCGKGHQIDGAQLSYKSGDEFFKMLRGQSDEPLVLFDEEGRVYNLATADLPSARGYGEPVTALLQRADELRCCDMVLLHAQARYLLVANDAYGFICQAQDLLARQRAGKSLLQLSEAARAMRLIELPDDENSEIFVLSTSGRALLLPVREVHCMSRGRGQKLLSLTPKDRAQGEALAEIAVLPPEAYLKLDAGRQYMFLKDFSAYRGARGTRGKLLPRGYRRVDSVEVIVPETKGTATTGEQHE